MEAFIGKWTFESSEGFAEIAKRLGASDDLVKIADTATNTVEFVDLGDGKYKTITENPVKKGENTFTLGEEFDETTADGRHVKTTITYEDGVMKIIQVGGGKTVTITRSIEGEKLKVIVEFEDLKATRLYTKA